MSALSEDLPFESGQSEDNRVPSLSRYRLLGNTGLKVSPIAYGAGSFGDAWGDDWSSGKTQAEAIFHRYIEAGGNFFDTSNVYQEGQSEQWLGQFMATAGNRDRLVISTKGTQNQEVNNPNGGGNGRKHIIKAVEDSLKRLKTDYIDLYFLHHWDMYTPVEEVLQTFETLIQQGKLRHFGLSNFPVWYATKLQMLAQQHFKNPIAAIQNQYSLAARHSDYEHLPMCRELSIGFTAWSPLANGLLSGKYKVDQAGQLTGSGRLTNTWVTDPSVADLSAKRNIEILTALQDVAQQVERSPSQVALNWMVEHRGVTSTIIGARKLSQLEDNLGSLEFALSHQQVAQLNRASEPELLSPYSYHTEQMQGLIHTGCEINN